MDAALLCQSYYRILRLANNLLDAAELEGPNRPGCGTTTSWASAAL